MASDYVTKTDAELASSLAKEREALRLFRFGIAGSKSRNVREGRTVRRTAARILTELSRRAQSLVRPK